MPNLQAVIDAFARWGEGTGSMLDLMPDEGIVVIPGTAPHCGIFSKREFVEQVATPFQARFSRPPVPRPRKIWAEGNDVAVLADSDGTTLDGQPYANVYVFVLEFDNDLLVKATEFLDMTAFNAVWDGVGPAPRTHQPTGDAR